MGFYLPSTPKHSMIPCPILEVLPALQRLSFFGRGSGQGWEELPGPSLPSIFVHLHPGRAESGLHSITGLKTDKNGPEVENVRRLLANE